MAERDFDAERKKRKGHQFTLGGQTFHTYAGLSLTFFQKEDDPDVHPLKATLDFIRSLLIHEDRERWDAMVSDPTVYIEADDLVDLSKWLLEVASGRPTKRRSSSGNGASPMKSLSKAPSSATPASGSKNSTSKKPSPSATSTSAK